MRRSFVVGAILVLALATFPAAHAMGGRAGRYIVVLKNSVDRPGEVAAHQARRLGLAVRYVYRSALKGYAARIPTSKLGALRGDPRVAFIAEDTPVHATAQSLPTG